MALQSTTALATFTLQSSSTSITLSTLPTAYRDLIIVGCLRTDRADTSDPVRLRFNNDSTNGNYTRVAMYGNGSSAAAYTDSPGEVIIDAGAAAASASSGIFSLLKVDIFDYQHLSKNKALLTSSNVSGVETRRQAARWSSLSAITSITITPYFGTNFVAGSTISLYGRIA